MSKIASVPNEFFFGSEQSESQVCINSSTQFTHVKIARNKYGSIVSVLKQNGGFLSTERNCGNCQTPWWFEIKNSLWESYSLWQLAAYGYKFVGFGRGCVVCSSRHDKPLQNKTTPSSLLIAGFVPLTGVVTIINNYHFKQGQIPNNSFISNLRYW